MEKIDFKKEYKELYSAKAAKAKMVEVPKFSFLMVDGRGDPNKEKSFSEAVEALYSVAYTAKFMFKEDEEVPDYVVPPLEGLWWAEDMEAFEGGRKDEWLWTLMILQPKWFSKKTLAEAQKKLRGKKDLPGLDKLRLESFREGKAAQIMHVGPYSEERATIEKMFAFIKEQGHTLSGKHHEIYLSDPRRCAPEKLKTILRHPVA